MERSRRCDTKEMPRKGAEKKKKIEGVCVAKRVAYIYGWMEWVRLWLGDPTLSNALSRTILSWHQLASLSLVCAAVDILTFKSQQWQRQRWLRMSMGMGMGMGLGLGLGLERGLEDRDRGDLLKCQRCSVWVVPELAKCSHLHAICSPEV